MFLPPAHVIAFFPDYRSTQTPWQALTPVAAWLIRDLGPARVVELGSYRGDSFFALVQAARGDERVKDLVAIDSWQGDHHTGAYGDLPHQQFMAELARVGDPRARAIRGYFKDAAAQFEPGSIDLLHIDGAHDYASVRADFDTWMPLMATNGVIVFHDIMVRRDGFGVWKLWSEIERDHPGRTFCIDHSNGLGILCLGDSTDGAIRSLPALAPAEAALIRDALRIAGERVTALTAYEHGLLTRNGANVPDHHVFARGEARSNVEALSRIEAMQGGARAEQAMDARIEHLVSEQVGDIFTALRPLLARDQASLRAALEDRIEKSAHHVMDDTSRHIDARIEQLFRDQAGDVFDALQPFFADRQDALRAGLEERIENISRLAVRDVQGMLDAQVRDILRRDGDIILNGLRPLLAQERDALVASFTDRIDQAERAVRSEAHDVSERQAQAVSDMATLREWMQVKNDAQDDAIIGMGAKVDAHEAAIQDLASYLRQLFQHPMLKG